MPKLTQQQLIDQISRLTGQPVELVENDTDSDFDESAFLSAIDTARTPIIKQLVSKDISGETSRKTHAAYRKTVSELFGIPSSEIADLEPKAMIEKGLTHYKSTLGDGSDTQKKIDAILADHARIIQEKEHEWSGKNSELETRLTRKSMIDVLSRYHKDAAGLPEKANREKLAALFLSHIEGKGVIKLNEAGDDIEIYDRKDPNTALLNSSNTDKMKVSDFMKPYYSELGMWNEDNRDLSATSAAARAATNIGNATPDKSVAQPNGSPMADYNNFAQQFK